ncbi:hypothetical protein DFR85_11960 [Acidianus brierleyi]|uniref:Uncharacterized protein n=2 Tax=Acidianus brierleyi TaxID=41673 RepID=A0A2U9IGV3_9CREN|nr:hypothetical protein DFR85_11960 [Acidianus brierleyi]
MVSSVGLSSITTSDVVSLIVAFVLGLLVGYLVKNIVKVGIVILAIIIILVAIGAISPSSIQHGLMDLGVYATKAEDYASKYVSLLPYNSIAFIIGFVIGLVKG